MCQEETELITEQINEIMKVIETNNRGNSENVLVRYICVKTIVEKKTDSLDEQWKGHFRRKH